MKVYPFARAAMSRSVSLLMSVGDVALFGRSGMDASFTTRGWVGVLGAILIDGVEGVGLFDVVDVVDLRKISDYLAGTIDDECRARVLAQF